jgi:hypothetical protein
MILIVKPHTRLEGPVALLQFSPAKPAAYEGNYAVDAFDLGNI